MIIKLDPRLEAAFDLEQWTTRRRQSLSAFTGATPLARAVGEAVIGETGTKSFRYSNGELEKLSEDELLQLGIMLFPQFADVFAKAWELHRRLPYSTGYGRKPFRAGQMTNSLLSKRRMFLASLIQTLRGYDQDLNWIAAHAAMLAQHGNASLLGLLFAAAIDLGGDRGEQIAHILRDSAAGTHETGRFGRHVVTGLLCCEHREHWKFMGKMLLAAQRQEGVRQVILETVDESHPDAFAYMLGVIIDNNLVRFSATVRAADVWLALQFDSSAARYIENVLITVRDLLHDPAKREEALRGDDAERAYFALWCIAFHDAPAAVTPSERLLEHSKPEMRFVALYLLSMIGTRQGITAIAKADEDSDLQVAVYGFHLFTRHLQKHCTRQNVEAGPSQSRFGIRNRTVLVPPKNSGNAFETGIALLERIAAKPPALKPLVWPWLKITIKRSAIADGLVVRLGEKPATALRPFIREMSPASRRWTADLLGLSPALDADGRTALLELVGDAAHMVRDAAVTAMRQIKISPDDLPIFEPLLSRKASDLRRGLLGLIMTAGDEPVLACAQRLLSAKHPQQRLAGLDLLMQMKSADRSAAQAAKLADGYASERTDTDLNERVYLETLQGAAVQHTLDDALGLMDPARRTPPMVPRQRACTLMTPAAAALLVSLDELIEQHRGDALSFAARGGDKAEMLLGAATHAFPMVQGAWWMRRKEKGTPAWRRPIEELPLRELWQQWWESRPADCRDADGLEAARAYAAMHARTETMPGRRQGAKNQLVRQSFGDQVPQLRHSMVAGRILEWTLAYNPAAQMAEYTLDVQETVLAQLPPETLIDRGPSARFGTMEIPGPVGFREIASQLHPLNFLITVAQNTGQWTPEHAGRLFGLQRWLDEPGPAVPRERRWEAQVLESFAAGVANEHDVIDALLGPRPQQRPGVIAFGAHAFSTLSRASAALRRGELPDVARDVVRRAVERVLEIELNRGEHETVATPAALAIKYAGGSETLIRILRVIGSDPKLHRGHFWGEDSKGKSAVLSHLIRATFPDPAQSSTEIADRLKQAQIDRDTLLSVAFYAPQWARPIAAALGWPMLEESIWWFHAHTRGNNYRIEAETRALWDAEIRKLTPLSAEDQAEGAVDVDWFWKARNDLGAKRWSDLEEFAKYASAGAGHTRAKLFADAMLGKAKRGALIKSIKDKRTQDAVRALGLVPLDKKDARKDLLERYRAMQEFVRTSRQFGSQRQASEKTAARIGQENLARTAGYPDPIRLQWAMEGLASGDLSQGPVVVQVKDVAVTLAIGEDGLPEVSVARAGRTLKAIPPETKKSGKVEELLERKTELRRSGSRMRQSLELAMCRGDRFGRDELIELMGNVVLRPLLERLVFIGQGIAGYPVGGGKALRDCAGAIEPIKADEPLRLAHPVDFLQGGKWSAWQRDCFAAERVQPFKQVFRELYVLTGQEKSDATLSRRYAGQQVNPRQAMALLGSRGWVASPEAGIFRTFHDEKIVAWVEFTESFFTPADVEGLTVERMRFARRGGQEYTPLTDLPPRLFSEVMRDVDLVVSVAHRGLVDPEASASTVELRSSLLRETVSLLKLENVTIAESHVRIRGKLAEYSVHLGSATVHVLPGGALFLVPVHSQHRGRLFLPFADDDPKTAEIISKVLLLARDGELRDPNLLDQIRLSAG